MTLSKWITGAAVLLAVTFRFWLPPLHWALHHHVHRDGVSVTLPFPYVQPSDYHAIFFWDKKQQLPGITAGHMFTNELLLISRQIRYDPTTYWEQWKGDDWRKRSVEFWAGQQRVVLRTQSFTVNGDETFCYVLLGPPPARQTEYSCLGQNGRLDSTFILDHDDQSLPPRVLASVRLDP